VAHPYPAATGLYRTHLGGDLYSGIFFLGLQINCTLNFEQAPELCLEKRTEGVPDTGSFFHSV
jgi:hypothetical protein